jgi:hypothetical protein
MIFMSWFWVKTWRKKVLIPCYAYTNVANRIVLSFVWRKFSSVGIGEWWDEFKNGKKLKLGDAHAPQEISKRYKRQSLGCPRGTPSSSAKKGHISTHYIFIVSCTIHFSWSVSCFSFQFCLVLFDAINGWTPTNFFRRSCLAFHLPRTLRFSLLSFNECSLFLLLRLAFDFHLDLCSDLVISLHQGVFWPLVHVGIYQKSYFKKVRMVLEKRKSFMQKSGTKRCLCRLRLRLLHVVLDVFLIACLDVMLSHDLSQMTEIA